MTKYQAARNQALQFLATPGIDRSKLRSIAESCVLLVDNLTGTPEKVDLDALVRDLEAAVSFQVGQGFVLDDNDLHNEWLPAAKSRIHWDFWDRYRQYLLTKEKPLPVPVVTALDDLTDKILERLENPSQPGQFDRRGMVVGHVQSGKTGNFVGLICKAADAGYRVIIVLSGLHDDLRSQTQMRVDEGFLGYSSATVTKNDGQKDIVGVGKLPGRAIANSLTAYEEDFSRAVAKVNVSPKSGTPIVLVVKKNKSILTNIITWLLTHAIDRQDSSKVQPITDSPLLVIDDEADQGSLNTKDIPTDEDGNAADEYDVTAINGKIRQILSLFEKKAYVGYTATPFANVFVHPDAPSDSGTINRGGSLVSVPYGEDLFPRSFIISLEPPENYIGATEVFGLEPDPEAGMTRSVPALGLIEPVDDYQESLPDGHKGDWVPPELPESLKLAIRHFFLVCAARLQRGQGREHNSMLVHVTRFTNVQKHVEQLVLAEVNDLKNRIRYGDGLSRVHLVDELKGIWETEFNPVSERVYGLRPKSSGKPAAWSDIAPHIAEAAAKIKVKVINGNSADVLDYQRSPGGASVIAIGGDKLSRGLTLEGLSISYFLRASKMYDTLMQMGRWFGYRDGYIDLCRIFTTDQLSDWYSHIALASEELRLEFRRMTETLGKKPKDYGLKVRSNPSGLLITSLVKMRHSTTLKVAYDGRIVETTVFDSSSQFAHDNLVATNTLLDLLPKKEKGIRGNYVWENVPAETVINFLWDYKTHGDAPEANSELMAYYIRRKSTAEPATLTDWTVVLVSNSEDRELDVKSFMYPVGLVERANKTPGKSKYTIQRLLSPAHEAIGMSHEQLTSALRDTKTRWSQKKDKGDNEPTSASGPSIRRFRPLTKGLLLIYPLDPKKAGLEHDQAVVGIGISFPGDKDNPSDGVEYEANKVYMGKRIQEE